MQISTNHAPSVNPHVHLLHSKSIIGRSRCHIKANSPFPARLSTNSLSTFPQLTPWSLSFSPSGVPPWLHTILLIKQLLRACLLQDSANTTSHGKSEIPSANFCASLQTSKASATKSPFFKYSSTRYVQESPQTTTIPYTSKLWSNKSAPWNIPSRPGRGLTQ